MVPTKGLYTLFISSRLGILPSFMSVMRVLLNFGLRFDAMFVWTLITNGCGASEVFREHKKSDPTSPIDLFSWLSQRYEVQKVKRQRVQDASFSVVH